MSRDAHPTAGGKPVWGWLRVFVGVVQLVGAGLGCGLLLTTGWSKAAWWSFAVMLVALATSRAIYRGRSGPKTD